MDSENIKLPPFIGYLPASIDSGLLELNNMTFPDYPPRVGRSSAELAESRRFSVNIVLEYFNNHSHRHSVEVLAKVMHEHKPFCLYLRNFDLGFRRYPAREDPFGLPQNLTVGLGEFDISMQQEVRTHVVPKVPAVCIRNPVEDARVLPAFVAGDDEWQDLARTLVRNAGLIVMYFLTATKGVAEELELIRREGKQAATLIVFEEGSPFQESKSWAALFGVQLNEPAKMDNSLDDFPHQVRHKKGAGWKSVKAKLAEMASQPLSPPIDQRIELPAEYAPPPALREYCTRQATENFDNAMELIEAKEFQKAEDILHRAFTYACWGRDRLGTAMTLMMLGNLNLSGFQAKGEAGFYFEEALEICKDIRSESPTAEQIYSAVTQQLGILRQEADSKRNKE